MNNINLIDAANQIAEMICKSSCYGSTCGTCQLFQLKSALDNVIDGMSFKQAIRLMTENALKEINRANHKYDSGRYKLNDISDL